MNSHLSNVGPNPEGPPGKLTPHKLRIQLSNASKNSKNSEGSLELGLHDELRVLTALIALAGILDNNTLKLPNSDYDHDVYGRFRFPTPPPQTRSRTRHALNAMAGLLVRKDEVVACTVPPTMSSEGVDIMAIEEIRPHEELKLVHQFPNIGAAVAEGLPVPLPDINSDVATAKGSELLPNIDVTAAKGPEPEGTPEDSLPFKAFSNTEQNDWMKQTGNDPNVRILKPRESYWNAIYTNLWELIER